WEILSNPGGGRQAVPPHESRPVLYSRLVLLLLARPWLAPRCHSEETDYEPDRSRMGYRGRAVEGLRRTHAVPRRRRGGAARADSPPRSNPPRLHRRVRGRGAPRRRRRGSGDPAWPPHGAAP